MFQHTMQGRQQVWLRVTALYKHTVKAASSAANSISRGGMQMANNGRRSVDSDCNSKLKKKQQSTISYGIQDNTKKQ